MNLMAVDDERIALDSLLARLWEAQPLAKIKGFLHYGTALAEIENGYRPDVAFLDMELSGMNGIVLAQRLQKVLPKINLIFVTGSTDYPYMPDAFALHASGYLTKSVSVEQLRDELNNLRYLPQGEKPHIRLQTRGDFEIFAGDRPLLFCGANKGSKNRRKSI